MKCRKINEVENVFKFLSGKIIKIVIFSGNRTIFSLVMAFKDRLNHVVTDPDQSSQTANHNVEVGRVKSSIKVPVLECTLNTAEVESVLRSKSQQFVDSQPQIGHESVQELTNILLDVCNDALGVTEKYKTVIQAFLVQQTGQGFLIGGNQLWNHSSDRSVSIQVNTGNNQTIIISAFFSKLILEEDLEDSSSSEEENTAAAVVESTEPTQQSNHDPFDLYGDL